jgi:hypothetical protein
VADDEVTRRRKAKEAQDKAAKKAMDAANRKKAKQAREVYKAWLAGQKAKAKQDKIRRDNEKKNGK